MRFESGQRIHRSFLSAPHVVLRRQIRSQRDRPVIHSVFGRIRLKIHRCRKRMGSNPCTATVRTESCHKNQKSSPYSASENYRHRRSVFTVIDSRSYRQITNFTFAQNSVAILPIAWFRHADYLLASMHRKSVAYWRLVLFVWCGILDCVTPTLAIRKDSSIQKQVHGSLQYIDSEIYFGKDYTERCFRGFVCESLYRF